MEGAQRLKIALDETRMLILGAQVLLGFQMRSVFQESFERVSGPSRLCDAIAVLLMVALVGLLIAPAAYHRLVDDGNATRRSIHVINLGMYGALLLFALALGINIFIGLERIAGFAAAAIGGAVGGATALVLWFGIEWVALMHKGGKVMNMTDQKIPLDKKIDQMLTEARVILPGAQALLGFQLAVIFTQAFEQLPSPSKTIHAAAVGLVALCTMLLITPAAYHRIVYGGEESDEVLTLGGRFVMAATVALALGLAADVYVVITKIAASDAIGIAAAALSLVTLVGLWHVCPWYLRTQRQGAANARLAAGFGVKR